MKSTLVFIGFILGIITTLVIFGVIPFQFIFTIQGSSVETLGTLGTWGAIAIALSIAIWGDWFKKIPFKSNMQIPLEKIWADTQQYSPITQGHVRLYFINRGNITAEDVEVYVNKIYDDANQERKSFLPVPLSWTHSGLAKRNFHPNQFGYLDFCRIDDISDSTQKLKLVLSAGAGVSNYEDIRSKTTKLEVVIFQKWGKVKTFEIILEWQFTKKHIFTIRSLTET